MRSFMLSVSLLMFFRIYSQVPSPVSVSEISRIENILAADNMQGRQVYSPGIEKAARFISQEFNDAGLKPLPGMKDYKQSFTLEHPEFSEVSAKLDGSFIDKNDIIAISADSSLTITDADSYQKIYVKKGASLTDVYLKYLFVDKNVLILVDTSFARKFARLAARHTPQFKGNGNRIFILTNTDPQQYLIEVRQKIKAKTLTNLMGMIPGISKPGEYVIFSAHYDHLGTGEPDQSGDSVYNGANDDASGITAIITLAKYFNRIHNNQRTLLFIAFTAEEIGELGSAYFAMNLDPANVVAMLNIEMIGTESKWGKNSAYITGFEKTNMGAILQKNLISTGFKFYPDPYPDENLFLRSDNASMAKMGVPAHTISTSKMDAEKYYHTQGDEVKTLDLQNMTEIIRAIGLSAGSIIAGNDTPSRVQPE
jgi:Zn-dependent M28 family amino/carboxypeptidase